MAGSNQQPGFPRPATAALGAVSGNHHGARLTRGAVRFIDGETTTRSTSEQLLKIGELAGRADVSTRTIDYYTTLGLLELAERTPGNFRFYDPAAVATINQLEASGVSLADIAQALSDRNTDVNALLHQFDEDLHSLRNAAETAGPELHGLRAAITARAHALVTTALEITATMPPV